MAGDVTGYYHRVQPYLDQELADRGDGGFWAWVARESGGGRVLELGAGTGRATAFLARAARQVVAFDLSPELVAIARRRLAGEPGVRLFVADMRRVRLAAHFDLVVAVDDPFSHLTSDRDRDQALARIAEHLAPGGRFVLDAAWLPPEQRRVAARSSGLTIESTHRPERRSGGAELQVRESWRCDASTRRCRVRFAYRMDGKEVLEAAFDARLWSLDELECRLKRAGLELVATWGDYDGRPWDRKTSPRLIAMAAASARSC